MFLFFPFAIAIIAAIVVFVIWAVKRTGQTQESNHYSESNALVILKERYAKGEISKSDYENIKKDIS